MEVAYVHRRAGDHLDLAGLAVAGCGDRGLGGRNLGSASASEIVEDSEAEGTAGAPGNRKSAMSELHETRRR